MRPSFFTAIVLLLKASLLLLPAIAASAESIAVNGIAQYEELSKPVYIGARLFDSNTQAITTERMDLLFVHSRYSVRKFIKHLSGWAYIGNEAVQLQLDDKTLGAIHQLKGSMEQQLNRRYLQRGDILQIESTATETRFRLNGSIIHTVSNPQLFNYLLNGWISQSAPSESFKTQLLSRNAPSSQALLETYNRYQQSHLRFVTRQAKPVAPAKPQQVEKPTPEPAFKQPVPAPKPKATETIASTPQSAVGRPSTPTETVHPKTVEKPGNHQKLEKREKVAKSDITPTRVKKTQKTNAAKTQATASKPAPSPQPESVTETLKHRKTTIKQPTLKPSSLPVAKQDAKRKAQVHKLAHVSNEELQPYLSRLFMEKARTRLNDKQLAQLKTIRVYINHHGTLVNIQALNPQQKTVNGLLKKTLSDIIQAMNPAAVSPQIQAPGIYTIAITTSS